MRVESGAFIAQLPPRGSPNRRIRARPQRRVMCVRNHCTDGVASVPRFADARIPNQMFDEEIQSRARAVLDACKARGLRVATAESLTGGLIAGALTEIPGSSDVVDRAFVTYSYEAKAQLLAVPYDLVAACGAVSEEVARRMAEGALARSHPHAQLAVAVTGVAEAPVRTARTPRAGCTSPSRSGAETTHAQRDFARWDATPFAGPRCSRPSRCSSRESDLRRPAVARRRGVVKALTHLAARLEVEPAEARA